MALFLYSLFHLRERFSLAIGPRVAILLFGVVSFLGGGVLRRRYSGCGWSFLLLPFFGLRSLYFFFWAARGDVCI